MNKANKSERETRREREALLLLLNLTRCCRASCAGASRRCRGLLPRRVPAERTAATQLSPRRRRRGSVGPTQTDRTDQQKNKKKPTQAFQSGTNRVYRAAEQPSSPFHPLHHVSGSLAFTGFVGRKIWVYVCTYNIWQRGGIQIQLRRMLFA